MGTQQSFLIIGNGIAGATAAEILRAEDRAVDITVITDDPCPVFYRPALKDYLGGKIREEKLWARPISFYPDRNVRFVTGRVVAIHPTEHSVELSTGQKIGYSRLLLAHGAQPTTLKCPGLNLQGVTTLRTVPDYQRVLARLNGVKRAVVVGAGTLALESIETLRHRGYEVTHLLRKRTLWSDVLDPVASDLVLQQEKRDGVDIRMEQEIAEIVGQQGQVTGVITTTGQHIPCELVLLGIGIEPNIDFVQAAGIACGRGVKVDAQMRTNVPDIYAVGDLIETKDPITGKSRVIGQWYPAIQQARAAAYSMLDLLDTHHAFHFGNFYNACMLYGLDFASVGISTLGKGDVGYQEIVADPRPREYQKVILKQGIPVGMLALGDRRAVLTYKRAIDHRVDLSPVASRLFDPTFSLKGWLDQQGVPSPILGVRRDGAVPVQKVAAPVAKPQEKAPSVGSLIEAKLLPTAPAELVPAIGEIYISQTQVATIGRTPGAAVPVPHHSVSRRHAEISFANGHYVLRDLGSRNGTKVNDQRLDPSSMVVLKTNDRIVCGDVAFAFKAEAVDPAASVLLTRKPQQAAISAQKQALFDNAAEQEKKEQTLLVPVSLLKQSQPVLREDGTLMLPELAEPLPASLVTMLQQRTALVAILKGQARPFFLAPDRRSTLGRQSQCTIVLPDMSVSRQHAEVFANPDGFYIRDLGSGNGVTVNGQRITAAYRLTHEERIQLGNVLLYFLNYPSRKQAPVVAKAPVLAASTTKEGVAPAHSPVGVKEKPVSFCRQCGAELLRGARFCPHCGSSQQ